MNRIAHGLGLMTLAGFVSLASAGGGFGGMGGGGFGGMGGMGGGGYGGMGGGNYRGMMTLQDALSSPDDEWAVLAPKVQRLVDAQAQLSVTGNTRIFRNGGMGGGAADNPVATTFVDLNNVLQDPTQGDDVVRIRLQAYRNAVNAAQAALTTAREDLRNYVTLRQEAILMGLGYLD